MATDFRLKAVSWPKLYHFSAFGPKSFIVFWPNLWADMASIIRRLTSQKTFASASSWAVHWPHMVLHSRSQHSLIFLLLSHVRRALALVQIELTLSQVVQTQKSVQGYGGAQAGKGAQAGPTQPRKRDLAA